jgi:hypothetical protein
VRDAIYFSIVVESTQYCRIVAKRHTLVHSITINRVCKLNDKSGGPLIRVIGGSDDDDGDDDALGERTLLESHLGSRGLQTFSLESGVKVDGCATWPTALYDSLHVDADADCWRVHTLLYAVRYIRIELLSSSKIAPTLSYVHTPTYMYI